MYHIFIIHSSVDRNVGWFCFLATLTGAAVTVAVQVPLSERVGPFEYTQDGYGWIYGLLFWVSLRVSHTDLHSSMFSLFMS